MYTNGNWFFISNPPYSSFEWIDPDDFICEDFDTNDQTVTWGNYKWDLSQRHSLRE